MSMPARRAVVWNDHSANGSTLVNAAVFCIKRQRPDDIETLLLLDGRNTLYHTNAEMPPRNPNVKSVAPSRGPIVMNATPFNPMFLATI